MKIYYCWRCHQEMPFLEEEEWLQIAPSLAHMAGDIKKYRKENHVDLQTALDKAPLKAKEVFEQITGYAPIYPNAIYHHRLSDWGQECVDCGHLLRTPLATACVHCGHKPD